jgi:mono/diheme cytochrome c family protein
MKLLRGLLTLLLLTIGMVACATEAVKAPEKQGDKQTSEINKLYQANCISCHASMFDGKAGEIFTRKDRKVKTLEGLKARVQTCATNLNLQWFDEEVDDVTTYLNQEFYHFKPVAAE